MKTHRRTVRIVIVALAAMTTVATMMLIASGCGLISGSGNVVKKNLDLADFTRVEVGSSFTVHIVQADTFAVTMELDDNIYKYLEAEVDGDTLHIGLQNMNSYSNVTLRATVALPELRGVELSGSSEGRVMEFDQAGPVRIGLSGSSEINIGGLHSGDGELSLSGASEAGGTWTMASGSFDLSGSSEANLRGSCEDLTLEESGASQADLSDFNVGDLKADMSGASECTVRIDGTLWADLSGASELKYIGQPRLGDISTSGASEGDRAE